MGTACSEKVPERMRESDVLKQVASLAVEVAARFKGEYPDDLLQVFTLVGKYLTIAGLSKEARKLVSIVTIPEFCPLCILYGNSNCLGCVLKSADSSGCGPQYSGLKQAVSSGTYMDVAFNMAELVKAILRKIGSENKGGSDGS